MTVFKEYVLTVDTMLDLKQSKQIIFNQNDYNTAKLRIYITHNDELFDLTGSTVKLALLKGDGTKVYQDCAITDAVVGEVETVLNSQSLAKPGIVRAELTVDLPGEAAVITNQFMFNVKGSIMGDDAIESVNEFPVLQKAIDAGEILSEITDLQTIVDNTTNVNNIKAEVEGARGTEANLNTRLSGIDTAIQTLETTTSEQGTQLTEHTNKLTEHDVQLAEIASQQTVLPPSAIEANTLDYSVEKPLILTDFSGYNQPYHPKVLHFSNGFGGYKYWMAQTPYPIGGQPYRDRWEVPVIYRSQDGVEWEVVVNPLDDLTADEVTNLDYMSDPHLVFHNGMLECWYRLTKNKKTYILRKRTSDGVNWGERETMIDTTVYGMVRSQSIFIEDGKYKMWYTGQGNDSDIGYAESTDGINWGTRTDVTINNTMKNWHIDVEKINGKYYLLGYVIATQSIELFESTDGINFTFVKRLLASGQNFYSSGLYRACITVTERDLRVYFSAETATETSIGLMVGTNFDDLKIINGQPTQLEYYELLMGTNQTVYPKTSGKAVFLDNDLSVQYVINNLIERIVYLEENGVGNPNPSGLITDGMMLNLNWKGFEAGTNTWQDFSPQANHATLVNFTHDGTTNGLIGDGIQFNGSNTYMTFANKAFPSVSNSFTIELSLDAIISKLTRQFSFGNDLLNLSVSATKIGFSLTSTLSKDVILSPTNGIYRLAITWDGAAQKLNFYNNGVILDTSTTTSQLNADLTQTDIILGAAMLASVVKNHTEHKIKSFRLYNKALSDAEVKNNYDYEILQGI